MSRFTFIVVCAVLVLAVSGRPTTLPSGDELLWPKPQSATWGSSVFSLSPNSFSMKATGYSDEVLVRAINRYSRIVFINPSPAGPAAVTADITTLTIDVKTNNTNLGLDTDESYTLDVTSAGAAIVANTVFGALRGLETFSQVVVFAETKDGATWSAQQVSITDAPRFNFRGYMIDTSRHWLPLPVIYQHLDAMAYNKFNVLHWHIVDGQSFPFESSTFPNISAQGSYTPLEVYSAADVQAVIAYGRDRGIRIVPEFDTPGHTYPSWGLGHAGLLTDCYDKDKKTIVGVGPINPTLDTTFPFLKAFFSEVSNTFADDYIHLGGDEVSFDCWQSNPQINQWMAARNWTDYAMLEQYYETNLLDIIGALGKDYVVWQEIFDNGLKVKPNTVIDVWKGGWQPELARVTAAGLRAIVSAPWYLNYISYGKDWPKYYATEPTNFTGTAEQKKLVMGGEVCMWGEYVDATNALSRTWPRASAVGERLWSAEDVRDVDDATNRIHIARCRIIHRGIPAEPANGPSYCDYEWKATYSPPWGN